MTKTLIGPLKVLLELMTVILACESSPMIVE